MNPLLLTLLVGLFILGGVLIGNYTTHSKKFVSFSIGGAFGGGITALDLDVVNSLNKDMTFNEAAQRVITMARNNDQNHEFD